MKNKKILLVTLHSVNIGNRLQNYALQSIIEKLGCDIYTPVYRKKTGFIFNFKEYCRIILGFIENKSYRYSYLYFLRKKHFEKFSKKYIKNRFKISLTSVYKKDWNQFDYAVTGSDQVWHDWGGHEDELNYFYLKFMPKEKRISYAPSFGFSEFPKEYEDIHKKGLSEIAVLSCREKKGVEIIRNLVKREAELVVDPTLLLTQNEWKKIELKPQYNIANKYVLLYFLGNKTQEYTEFIEKYAEENKCKIIDVYDISIEEYFVTRPDEFLWLVHNAEYVFTDSFHACVFSIIYNKKFLAFKRCERGMDKMFDRIESLLSEFQLESCIYQKDIILNNEIDYAEVNKLLEIKAEKGKEYLKKALNIEPR